MSRKYFDQSRHHYTVKATCFETSEGTLQNKNTGYVCVMVYITFSIHCFGIDVYFDYPEMIDPVTLSIDLEHNRIHHACALTGGYLTSAELHTLL